MAYQKIGIGSSANDGTGDTLRVGADKINENFEDLFGKINGVANSAISNGTALTTDTVVLRTATQTLTNKTLTTPNISVISNSGNLTLPSGLTDTLVSRTSTDTLENKTLTSPLISTSVDMNGSELILDIDGDTSIKADTDDRIDIKFAGNDRIQLSTGLIDLKNDGTQSAIRMYCESANQHYAALTAPAHSDFSGNITITLPSSTDTLVGRATTDTLTNKTLTAPAINGATFSGVLGGAIIGGVESKSGAGALSLTHLITEVTSTGTDSLTLANGTAGQIKIITMIVDGGDATLQPTTFHDGTNILFDAVGESVVLVYHNTIGWKAVSVSGATIS